MASVAISSSAASGPTPPSVDPAYAIFEGGGAKGITHLGAVKAMEDARLEIVGAAGSSAGAIVAALVAVGYRADELYDIVQGTDLLTRNNKTPVDLLGRVGWWRLKMLRWLLKPLAGLCAAMLLVDVVLLGTGAWGYQLVAVSVTATFLVLLGCLIGPVILRRGLFDSVHMRAMLDTLLRDKINHQRKLAGKPLLKSHERVRFDHLKVRGCVPLKVIVSDARSGKMIVFDQKDGDANVVIADAVAASAAIPFVIRSPVIEGAPQDTAPIYMDGGLISNLPAWAFRNEKRALERLTGINRIPLFAFTLDAMPVRARAKTRSGRPGLVTFISSVVKTGIFGSQEVVQEFVPDLEVISLPSPLNTLSFDCDRKTADAAFTGGLESARRMLTERRRTAELTARILKDILAEVERSIAARRTKEGRPTPRLRLSLIDPINAQDAMTTSFRVVASAGMDGDADDRLEFDNRNDIAPRCFKQNSPLLGRIGSRPSRALVMTKYERALIRPDVDSAICIPILPVTDSGFGSDPERVLCMDSSDALDDEVQDPAFMKQFRNDAIALAHSLIAQQS
jgi:NTE family protein